MRLGDVLRGIGRPVTYFPALCPMVGGVNACILLCHLLWWSDQGDDPEWIYKTQRDIEDETGLTRREQDTARAKLVDLGLVLVERRGVPPVLHYHVDIDALELAWEAECTKAPNRMHSTADTSAPKRQILTTTKKTKEAGRPAGAVEWARRHGLAGDGG